MVNQLALQHESESPSNQRCWCSQAVLEVVLWLHEEEAVDAPYIQAVLAELEAACEACSVPVPAKLRALSLEVALQQGSTSQVRCYPVCHTVPDSWTGFVYWLQPS